MPPSDPALGLGQKASDLYDEPARRNFRVVVICPEVVEAVDLTHPEAATREKWSLLEKGDGQGMEWKHEELWP